MSNPETLPPGYDFNKQSELVALDLIYLSNQYKVPLSKIKFFTPKIVDITPDIPDDPNTFVDVYIDHQFDYRLAGNTGFIYRRLPMVEVGEIDPDAIIIPPQVPFKVSDVLDQINDILNTQLTTDDILDLTYGEGIDEMIILANPDSLVWIGELTLNVDIPTIPPLVQQTELSGFNVYVP